MVINDLMKAVKSRRDCSGFLDSGDIGKINGLKVLGDIRPLSLHALADKAYGVYSGGNLSEVDLAAVLELCCASCTAFRTESHRYSYGEIYKYDKLARSYIFDRRGTHAEFLRLNHFLD